MKPAVVIPWYPSTRRCVWRDRWFALVLGFWRTAGLGPVLIGIGEEGAARNQGVRAAALFDVYLIADADSLIPVERAVEAVEAAAAAPGLVVPHDRYVQLGRSDSDRLAGGALGLLDADGRLPAAVVAGADWHGPGSVGGPVAFSADTWEAAGGYDEAIVHGHDAAFAQACFALAGPGARLPGDMIHLWHPRPPDAVQDPPETWTALHAYHAAAEAGPDAMRALVRSRVTAGGHRPAWTVA